MTVTCTVTDSASVTAAASTSVDVSPSPSVVASASHSSAAPGSSITFSAQATGGPGGFSNYAWSFGDGATGSGAQVVHAFTQAASYQASVVVTDANGGTASGSVSVTISNVQVTASATPASGSPDTLFQFTATANGGGGEPFTYSWDFGDGQSGGGTAVSHTYPAPGNYTPAVRATDSLGASRTVSLSPIAVSSTGGPPVEPLSVTMSLSTSLPRVNESVSLSGTGQGGSGGYNCAWDFGDGGNSAACSTSHAWRVAGHYVVDLALSDSGGNRTSSSRSVDVQADLGPPGGPLTVTFRMTTSLAAVNETVSFVATGGGGSGGYACSWYFGDNTSATGCSASHAWNATGSYRVLLVVSDSSGHHASSAQSVDVVMALAVRFEVGPSPAIVGETAELVAHPTGGVGPYNCTWDFGDASGASGCPVSHTWTTRGRFVIRLSVNDSANQSVAVSETIGVESSGLFGLPMGVDLLVLASPLVVAALGVHLWNVWRNRDPVPQGLDSVEASVLSTLVGNVKRLSRWRPGRGAGHRLPRFPRKKSGSKADQDAGGDDHQDPVQ
jgi:PKD repeat protein